MPLVAWSVLVYAAALIVALSLGDGARLFLGAMALAAVVVLAILGRRVPSMVCGVAAAGMLMGAAAERVEQQCGAGLAERDAWMADIDSDAAPGSVTRGVIRGEGCQSRATLLVASGRASAGDRIALRGHATSGQRGMLIGEAEIVAASHGPPLKRAWAAAGRRIDRVFGTDAPMVRALVIADMSRISAEQRDRFARSGLVHMLSVSGLHVGIVALALELLASVLRLPRTPARVATMLLLAIYVAAIGAPPPAVRAAVMLGALLGTRVIQRPTSPWAILALGAAAPLWDPRIALDLGWQLSVAGTAALVAGGSLARRTIPRKWRGLRRAIATAAIVSVVATAATAPLVAWVFGRVALLGPVTNLLADPVMGILQPLLFVAMAIPVPAVESFIAGAVHALLAAFDGIARVAADIPGAAPMALPSALGAVAAGVAAVALLVGCMARRPMRAAIVGTSALAVLIVEPIVPHAGAPPELHMIDVGQGDALALRSSRGRWIVVDAGRSWIGGDAGQRTVVPYLSRRGSDVAAFVLSHPHADHVGGALSLIAALRPGRFLDPGYVGTSRPYLLALAGARTQRVPWQRVRPGDSLVVDDVVLTMLAPDSAWTAGLDDANLASTVMVARVGKFRVLFTGDAEAEEEDWLLANAGEALRADVLKVAHHGSATSTTPEFLAAVRPKVALVSVGAQNAYGHPDADVMGLLRTSGVATLRTDQHGTVVLRFLPQGIEVRARGGSWLVPGT